MDNGEPHLLLDVRPLVEVDICHLPFSLSILLSDAGTESASLYDSELSLHVHPRLSDCSPYIDARHSPLKFRGEKD